ncbi:TetR/AcrR family transcriptional regulator [Frankia sp. AiPs1]|uniref:TetR/AcrR family transcriptional regulator n=1 Tax=Frankia sp. AiPa1 TaxID=573492 RepID=UPI00202B18E9|nr:TetR/AcrR family transcriptional regulator [Frankia sp. AiPa1]MCL9760234.1 TetR/AcrR family transcriptional regulator [Frankia sp. AiPa1]
MDGRVGIRSGAADAASGQTARAGRSPRGGDKRRDLLDGSLAAFARDGYTRASIDAIAKAAGVSSRTIYNHFGDKAALFHAVIVDSARQVADAQVGILDRYLGKIVDIEADLREFGRVWATPVPEFADHFTLVRQVIAEAAHIPPATLEAWQEQGPRRVRRAMAAHLLRIAEQGHLSLADPDLAAAHLALLVTGDVNLRSLHGAVPLDSERIHAISDAGVRVFLHGYGLRGAGAVAR